MVREVAVELGVEDLDLEREPLEFDVTVESGAIDYVSGIRQVGGMPVHGFRQRSAKARVADVETVAALAQRVTDAPRGRGLLVHDDQDRLQHRRNRSRKTPGINGPPGRGFQVACHARAP